MSRTRSRATTSDVFGDRSRASLSEMSSGARPASPPRAGSPEEPRLPLPAARAAARAARDRTLRSGRGGVSQESKTSAPGRRPPTMGPSPAKRRTGDGDGRHRARAQPDGPGRPELSVVLLPRAARDVPRPPHARDRLLPGRRGRTAGTSWPTPSPSPPGRTSPRACRPSSPSVAGAPWPSEGGATGRRSTGPTHPSTPATGGW